MGKVGVVVRVVPEPRKEGDTSPVIFSLVLQPDDSAAGDLDLQDWPKVIAEGIRGGVKLVGHDGNGESELNGDPLSDPRVVLREWIPLSTASDLDQRKALWIQAIGKDQLEAFASQSKRLFVAEESPRKPRIFSSPVERLAMAMTATTAISAFQQMVAHVSEDKADLHGPGNPLAPLTLQSQVIFDTFVGSRPDAPAVQKEGEDSQLRDLFDIAGDGPLDTLTQAKTAGVAAARSIETFAQASEPPRPRFDTVHDMKPTEKESEPERRDHPTRVGRLSAAMVHAMQHQTLFATPGRDGHNFRRKGFERGRPDPLAYFEQASSAFYGEPSAYQIVPDDPVKPTNTADYAAYLLSMQPDDQSEAKARLVAARDATTPDDHATAALRTVAGMYAYPQLAAYFGLLVDIEIDPAILAGMQYLSVQLPGLAGLQTTRLWTAIEPGKAVARAYDPSSPAAQVSNGMLHLGDTERFGIISLDVNAALDGSFSASRSDRQSRLDGARTEELSSALPAHRGVGLAITDTFRRVAASDETVTRRPLPSGHPLIDHTLFLEDLIAGYRIDVQTNLEDPEKPTEPTALGWLSLMDRDVDFSEIREAMENSGLSADLLSSSPSWAGDRLGGMVQPMHREVVAPKDKDINAPPDAVVFDTLATWRNWSLAVPSMAGETLLLRGEIQLEREIEPKPGSLPPLRFGARVKLGARCVMINGASISLADAEHHYSGSSSGLYVLRDGATARRTAGSGDGYLVLRHEPLATPRVFIPGARKPDASDKAEPSPRQIVVSADQKGPTKRDGRIVLPGEVSFDTCELHGMFDSMQDIPEPPFQDLELTPPLGRAPNNTAALLDNDDTAPLANYPDPMAGLLSLAFVENGAPAEEFGFAPPRLVDLYGSRQWPQAAPLLVELKAVPAEDFPLDGGIVGDFEDDHDGDRRRIIVRLAPAEEIELAIWSLPARLNDYLKLAPAQAAALFATLSTQANNTPATTVTGSLMAALHDFATTDDSRFSARMDAPAIDEETLADNARLLLRAFRRLPIPWLSSHQTVRLVHAVRQPLLPPAFTNLWLVHAPSPLPNPLPDQLEEEKIRAAWKDRLGKLTLNPGDETPNPAEQPDAHGKNRVFFGGALTFHRKSTVRLDVTAAWHDWRDDIAPRLEGGKYCYRPEPHAEVLTSLDNIPYRAEGEVVGHDVPARVGLALMSAEEPTYLGYTFRDTRARKLQVTARALSRFKSHFARSDSDRDTEYLLTSDAAPGGKREIIVLSTERPKPLPEPLFCMPSLHYKTVPGEHHYRTVRMRFDLGDRFYSSGFEEKVGVVCWPPDLFVPDAPGGPKHPLVDSITVEQVEVQIHASVTTNGAGLPRGVDRYVTRWGREPIHISGQLNALIPSDAFRNSIGHAQYVDMPLPQEKPKGPAADDTPPLAAATLKVSLALYEPILDPETGRFYVDVEIQQDKSYEPLVTVGLVRYQANSIEGYKCSLPVPATVRIPADRKLELEFNDATREISLRYSGVGFDGTAIPAAVQHQRALDEAANRPVEDFYPLERSAISVTVQRDEPGRSGSPVVLEPLTSPAGAPPTIPDGRAHISKLWPRISDGKWVVGRFAEGAASFDPMLRRLVLPADCDPTTVSIWLTEHEYLAGDDYRKTLGSSQNADGTEEPLGWSDSVSLPGSPMTIVTGRLVSSVHIRLTRSAETGSASTEEGEAETIGK